MNSFAQPKPTPTHILRATVAWWLRYWTTDLSIAGSSLTTATVGLLSKAFDP